MILEERKTHLFSRKNNEHLKICRDNVWPSIMSSKGSILCVSNGFIGIPKTTILQIIAYPDIKSWQTSQGAWSSIDNASIKRESVRILRPINSQPKLNIPPEDRKNIYEYRKYLINPVYLNEFTKCFDESIYPHLKSLDIPLVGIWTLSASTSPLEIIQMTGYDNIIHWDQTRIELSKLDDNQNELWNRGKALRNRFDEITIESSVMLMESTII